MTDKTKAGHASGRLDNAVTPSLSLHDIQPVASGRWASGFRARRAMLARLASGEPAFPAQDESPARNHIWITTSCGQRLSIFQIGTLFGRE